VLRYLAKILFSHLVASTEGRGMQSGCYTFFYLVQLMQHYMLRNNSK